MQLNKTLRTAIVQAIMADVPFVDYDEQVQTIVTQEAYKTWPNLIKRVWDDAALRGYLDTGNNGYNIGGTVEWINHPGDAIVLSPEVEEQCRILLEKQEQQLDNYRELERGVKSAIEDCKTTQQFIKMLPEFEKYVPKGPEANSRSVPVLANLVSNFVRAGWPKGAQA